MSTYFTSDTHFGSERTLELSKRPFASVKEMDDTMISNWNKIVTNNDYVYHLGDFGNYEVVPKLNGKITLIWGNYELKEFLDKYRIRGIISTFQYWSDYVADKYDIYKRNHMNLKPDSDENYWQFYSMILNEQVHSGDKLSYDIQEIYNCQEKFKSFLLNDVGFADVVDFSGLNIRIEKGVKTYSLYMNHEPCMLNQLPTNDYEKMLFGHIHGRQMVKKFGLDVGVDAHHFRPISTDDVIFYLEAINEHYDYNVFF